MNLPWGYRIFVGSLLTFTFFLGIPIFYYFAAFMIAIIRQYHIEGLTYEALTTDGRGRGGLEYLGQGTD